jgi:hypothetical protein
VKWKGRSEGYGRNKTASNVGGIEAPYSKVSYRVKRIPEMVVWVLNIGLLKEQSGLLQI